MSEAFGKLETIDGEAIIINFRHVSSVKICLDREYLYTSIRLFDGSFFEVEESPEQIWEMLNPMQESQQ